MPQMLRAVLESKNVVLMGTGIKGDVNKLNKVHMHARCPVHAHCLGQEYAIRPTRIADVSRMAYDAGLVPKKGMALADVTESLLKRSLLKDDDLR
jgi:hypothetical protein